MAFKNKWVDGNFHVFMVSLSQRLPVTIGAIVGVLVSIRRSLGVPGPHARAQCFMLWSVFVVMAILGCSAWKMPGSLQRACTVWSVIVTASSVFG